MLSYDQERARRPSGSSSPSLTLHLVPSAIDRLRMVIRIEQGKGRKDRYDALAQVVASTERLLVRYSPR